MKPYLAYKASNVEWLGMVPKHWEVKPTKYIFFFINRGTAPTYTEEENKTMVVNQATFSQGKWNINKIRYTTEYFDSSRGALIPKDILIASTGGGVLGKVFYFEEENGKYIADSHVTILRTNPKNAHSKFYSYIFSILYNYINAVLAFGSTNQTELQRERLKSHKLPSPPLPEQQAIVDYLDRETAEMDALITEQEELVSLLKQKRSAIISEAVCRGLDPTVPMKDSEVEWLGMVPAHWEIRQIKSLSLVKRGASPRPIDKACYYDENGMYQWVRISDVSMSNGFLEQAGDRLSKMGESCSVRLEPGSLFVSICASVGKPCITNIKCCIHDGFAYFPNISKKHNKYLFYIFLLGKCYQGLGKLGTQLNLNTDIIGSIKIPIPPLSEQQSIVNYLDHETSEIDHLIADCETSIQLLKQRRTALISEAVTGKIDVRTA